ncbi:hypothetical protein AB5I39_11385 [Sphingomonas sp. MMS24-J45]|uniref:hypothetical protein n=1 Tax=Sphingomonas sp. MMS24-J45 TaxID=3238806 RepID=UPI00384F23F9
MRHLALLLDRDRYEVGALACFRQEGVTVQAHVLLEAAGVAVDPTPWNLSFEDTVSHLASVLPVYDVVVACQDVADVAPALERLSLRPALIDFSAENAYGWGVSEWQRRLATALVQRPAPARPTGLFRSFLQGGFECSTHRRAADRQRIDMIAASHHDLHAEHDYRELARHGIDTVRDGVRWHLIEAAPGHYDWSSLDRQLAAARATGTEMIWDLLHYGWPDHLDIWSPAFVERFAAFAAAAARHIGPAAPGERRFYAPVNEISFFAWGGGDVAYMNPFARGRGFELKVQLARASIAAMDAILTVDPAARFIHADPVINIVADPATPEDVADAFGHRHAQFQAWDMIAGRAWPQIGGRADLLDIVGVNFYHNNQWMHRGETLPLGHLLARPFRDMLAETYARYGCPIFVAETGIEGDARPAWLRMILKEVDAAIAMGVPVEGVCLYPILDHPGWDDGRYCPNGLLTHGPTREERRADARLAEAIAEARRR